MRNENEKKPCDYNNSTDATKAQEGFCKKCTKALPENAAFCPWCGRAVDYAPHRKKRGNGQGSVYKRGDTWTASVTLYMALNEAGDKAIQRRRTKSGFKTKRDAVAYIEELRSARGRKVPTLLDYYEIFERDEAPKLSKNKQCAYRIARRRLDNIIGLPVDQLTLTALQGCLDSEVTTYYPAKDIKDLLSKLFQKAMADQFVTVNLSRHLVLPELAEAEPEPFTAEEVKAFWAAFAAGDVFAGYPLLMIYSGMMPGELLACKKSSIDLAACEIRGAGKKTKTRKATPIVYPEFLSPVVTALLDYSAGDKLVTMNKDTFYGEFRAATSRAGVRPLPPYSCRHTTGTEAARTGVAAPILQQIMRHAKITTTQRYIHLDATDAHEGIEKLNRIATA